MNPSQRRRSVTALIAAFAVLSSLFVVTPSAIAAGETASLQMEFTATGTTTRQSGTPFTALASFSCVSPTGASCDNAVMTIPWPADPDTALGATGIDTWTVAAASNEPGMIASEVVIDPVNRQWVINFSKPILSNGSAVGVQLTFTGPASTTPNNFKLQVQPTVSGSTFAPVTAPAPVVYTSTASSNKMIAKNLVGLARAGEEIDWTISWRDSYANAPGNLGTIAGTRTVVDVLPPEVEFLGVVPAGVPHDYDDASRTLTFYTSERPYPNNGSTSYTVKAKIKDDVEDGTVLSNTATLSFKEVGNPSLITVSSTTSDTVSDFIPVGDVFSKTTTTNLSAGSESGSVTKPLVATSVQTDVEVRYSLKVNQINAPIDFEMIDPLPCLPGVGARVESGAVDAVCDEPAFHVTRLVMSLDPSPGSTGSSTGKVVDIRYTDGTSENQPLRKGSIITPKAGGIVNRVTMSGSQTAGSGSTIMHIFGTIDASLEGRREILGIQNTVYNRVAVAGKALPAESTPFPADATIARDETWASVTQPSTVVLDSGIRKSTGIYTKFFSANPDVVSKQRTLVVLPDADFDYSFFQDAVPVQDDWQGTGRKYYEFGIERPSTGSIYAARANVPAGVYPYDVYVGFAGVEFDTCTNQLNGSPLTFNDRFVDTSGLLAPVGVPTTVCHMTAYLVVPGPIPDSSTIKMVRGGGDATWLPSPGTSQIDSDGEGWAEFRVTWANTGASTLQNVTLYDMLPTVGDAYTVGLKSARGTTFTPGLRDVKAPAGWTVAYSVAENPCRPQVLAVNPGCDPAWSTTAPSPLSQVTALRFQKSSPSAVGLVADFIIEMDAEAMDPKTQVAWNSVATRAYVAGTTPAPIAQTETPKVGFGLVEGPGILLQKEVCTEDNCADDAAVGTGGWASSTTIDFDGDVKWRVTANNVGFVDLTDVAIADPLVADCAMQIGDLAIDAQAQKVCTTTGLRADLTNVATVTGVGDGQTVSDTATATATVGAKPVSSIELVKQVCDATATACNANAAADASEWKSTEILPFEGTANWRVIVKNTGATTLTNVSVSDLGNLACADNIASLAAGASQTLSCANATLSASMVNTAAVNATPPFGDPALTDTATATATVTAAVPGVSLTKEICTTDTSCAADAALGEGGWGASASIDYFESVQWRLIATNTGENQLTSLSIADPAVADCVFASTGPLDRGKSVQVICSSEDVTASFVNTATVTAKDVEGVEVTDNANAAVVVATTKPVSSIDLVHESCDPEAGDCDPDAPIGEGGWSASTTVPFESAGKWRTTIKNTGATTLTNVRVSNPDYSACEFTLTELLSGESKSKVCSVESVDGLLSNTATVRATPPYGDADLTKEDSAKIVSVPPRIQIDVQKEVCSTGNDCDPNADPLTGGWVKSAELEPGTEPLWRVIVTNNSQVKLVDVTLADDSLSGCSSSYPELAAGASKTLSCKGSAAFEATGGPVVATGTNPRSATTETVTAESEASITVRAFTSKVSLVKEACVVATGSDCRETGTGWKEHATGAFNSEMWWRITVTNTGDTDLTQVAVTDKRFPTGDFTIERLKGGESKALVFSAGAWKVTDPASADAKNTATVSAVGVRGDTLTAESSAIGSVAKKEDSKTPITPTPTPVPKPTAPPVAPTPEPKPAEKLSVTGAESLFAPLLGAFGLLLAGTFVLIRRRA